MRNLKPLGKPLLYLSLIFIFSASPSFAANHQSRLGSWGKNISALFQHKKAGEDNNKVNNSKNNPDTTPVINNTIDTNRPDNNTPTAPATPIVAAVTTTDTPPSITTSAIATPKTTTEAAPAPDFIPTAYAAPAGDTLYGNQNFSRSTTRLLNEIAIALGVIGLLLTAGGDKWLRNKLGVTDFNSKEQLTST